MTYFIALISIILGSAAQYLFKLGVSQTEALSIKLIKNTYLWGGIGCYGVSLLLWFYVLSKMELSKAYPLVGLGYVFTLLIGHFLLSENINIYRIVGVVLIVCGVFFVSRS